MSAEHRDRGSLRRLGLGPNTLRRMAGGSLGRPDTPNIMESLVGMGSSLRILVSSSSLERKTEDEENFYH